MELVPTDGSVEVLEPTTTTTRNLTITVKVNDTADIDKIVSSLGEWGEVTGVNYYQQTYTNTTADPGYIY